MNSLLKLILYLPNISLSKGEWALVYAIIEELNAEKNAIITDALALTSIDSKYIPDIIKHLESWHKSAPMPVPNIPLTPREINDINDIFLAYYLKRCSDFQKRISQTVIKPTNISGIVKYIDAWHEAADTFLFWITQHLYAVWAKVNNNTPCGADALVPLIMQVLSDEVGYLKQILEKLIQAEEIEQRGETACYLVSLHIAIETKIREIQSPSPVIQDPPDRKVTAAATELLLLEKINIILDASNDYLSELLDTFFAELKTSQKAVYTKYCSVVYALSNKKILMESIIVDMVGKKIDLNDEILQLYIAKYDAMVDLQASLIRENDNTRMKLEEFAKKFVHHKITLQKSADNKALAFFKSSGSALGLGRLYNLLQSPSKQDVFIDMANLVSHLFGAEKESKENIRLLI
jgi:hypothetical protein